MPLAPRLYFANAAGRLLEHPDGYVVFQYLPGQRQLADLQSLLVHTEAVLRRNNWYKILGDQRQMTPFTEEESAWIVNYWLHKDNHRPGGLYAAVVLAEDVFARLVASQLHQETTAALTYRLFDHEEQAAAWLQQLD